MLKLVPSKRKKELESAEFRVLKLETQLQLAVKQLEAREKQVDEYKEQEDLREHFLIMVRTDKSGAHRAHLVDENGKFILMHVGQGMNADQLQERVDLFKNIGFKIYDARTYTE